MQVWYQKIWLCPLYPLIFVPYIPYNLSLIGRSLLYTDEIVLPLERQTLEIHQKIKKVQELVSTLETEISVVNEENQKQRQKIFATIAANDLPPEIEEHNFREFTRFRDKLLEFYDRRELEVERGEFVKFEEDLKEKCVEKFLLTKKYWKDFANLDTEIG